MHVHFWLHQQQFNRRRSRLHKFVQGVKLCPANPGQRSHRALTSILFGADQNGSPTLLKAATVQSGSTSASCSGFRAAASNGVVCTCPVASTARQSATGDYYCVPNSLCTASPCSTATSLSLLSVRGSQATFPSSSPYYSISYTAFPFLSFSLKGVRALAGTLYGSPDHWLIWRPLSGGVWAMRPLPGPPTLTSTAK